MAWLCLKDNALSGSQICIVTGPRIDLAIALIDRMKKLFSSSKGIASTAFDTKETVIELNNVKIEAFPSHHLDAMRGLPVQELFSKGYSQREISQTLQVAFGLDKDIREQTLISY